MDDHADQGAARAKEGGRRGAGGEVRLRWDHDVREARRPLGARGECLDRRAAVILECRRLLNSSTAKSTSFTGNPTSNFPGTFRHWTDSPRHGECYTWRVACPPATLCAALRAGIWNFPRSGYRIDSKL